MAEDTGQPAPAGTEASPATTPAPEVNFVNLDGTLADGWQGKLTDETLRTDETLSRFNNFNDLAKSYVNVRRQVPMDKIVLPGVNATDDELNEFFKAIGRPDTPEDYTVEVPEGLEDYYDDPLIAEAKTALHKVGLTQKQVDVVMALDRKRLELGAQQEKADDEKEKADMITALRNRWGTAYDERLHLANRMINDNTAEGEQRASILEAIGNNPYVGDFLANIASKFVEHKIITDIETPSADLEGKKKELMNSKEYQDANHPDHKATVAAVQSIFAELVKLKSVGTTV